jgi:MFS family permease
MSTQVPPLASRPAVPSSEPTPPAPRWRLSTFRALQHRNYRLYFVGQLVSLTGTWVQAAALTWVAYDLTGQNRWPALVAAAQGVPTLLLGVWGGSLADRWPRRTLIFATQALLLLLALLLAALVALGLATPWHLLAISAAAGVVNAVDTPARLAFVIDMVGREDLANAVALNSLLFNLARAVGPAVGAELLCLGAALCFLVNGLSFVAVLAALAWMDLAPPPPGPETRRPAGGVGEGFAHLARHPALLLLVILAGALAFFGWPVLSLLPDLSVKRLDAGNRGYAWMLSAVGFGALVGALVVASFGSGRRRTRLLGGGAALTALALFGLAAVTAVPLAVGCCAALGCGLILFFASGQAALQLGSDDHNRGRILGIWLMVLSGAQPAGNVLAGQLADAWGVARVLAFQGTGVAVAAAGAVVVVLGWRLLGRGAGRG